MTYGHSVFRGRIMRNPAYHAWRKHAHEVLDTLRPEGVDVPVFSGYVGVELRVYQRTPTKTSLAYPRGDIDNYIKAALDSITTCEWVWSDDTKVAWVRAAKYWDDTARVEIRIWPCSNPKPVKPRISS